MKKLLLTFLIAFITALGMNAADLTSPYSHTFKSGQLTKAEGSNSLSGVNWSWSAMTYCGFQSNGVQIGSKNDPQNSDWTISTSEIPGTITSVKVTAYAGGSGTIKVSVGGKDFTYNNSINPKLPASYGNGYDFTGSASGEIAITMKAGSKAMYLQSIEVTFTTGGGSSETKELGPIMMGSTPVSTVEATPTTATVKGDAKIEFTSANAASISVYTLPYKEEDKPAASEGSPSVTWKAPAAKESEQTVRLKVVSKLGTDIKEAYVTVTVQKKADVSDNFVLITDAEELFDGMEFYIADTNGKFVMGADKGNNRTAVSGAQITNNILTPKDTYSLVTLVDTKKTTSDSKKLWYLTVGEGTNLKYLKNDGGTGKNNYLKESDTPQTNSVATISISSSNNNATIQFQNGNPRNTIMKHSSSALFACYTSTSGQTAIKIYGKKAAPSVKVPGDVTSEPAAVEGVITINKNDEITFSSKDAAKLKVSTQSEPVVGSSYKYAPTVEGEVTITPIDSEGKVYNEKAATFTIKFFVAPEAPTFTPDGGEVDLFSSVTVACATEGATLTYKIGDGEAKAYPADGIKMTEAGEVTITAIATKNGLSTETTKTFNVTDKREKVYVRFDAKEYEFTVGEEFESPVAKACNLENEHFVEIPDFTETINYESDNTSVAEVNATTGALTLKAAGTCKITASLKSETYKSDPDYYTLTVNKGLVDGTISYKTNTFTYTIGSEATLPELVKEPADVDVEYSISHERVENGVAVYNPATIDEQGNITVNTPGIVTVTATVKADRSKTASYVLEIQSLREAEIAGTGSATPTGNVYTKVVDDTDVDLYENGHLYAILSYHDGKVYAMTPEDAGSNEGLKAVVIKEGVTGFEEEYTIDNSAVANMLFDLSTLCLTYNDNGTLKYLVSPSDRHMQLTAETPTESHYFAYSTYNDPNSASLKIDGFPIDGFPIYCNPDQLYFNTFESSNSNFGTHLFNCFLYKVGAQITSASTVKAPVVHITGGNVYYSPDGEWYWGTEDERYELSFANETDGAQIYYTMTSANPSSANVRAMDNSETGTSYSKPFKKSDLDGMKITFWAEKDGQKSAVETLNFNIKTGIEDIDVENGEAIEEEGDARYFNLQGLEVKNPGEGIYIRVANGKATKILKK